MTLNRRTVSYRGGQCSKSIGLLSVNIGTVLLGNLKNKPEYFRHAAESKVGRSHDDGVALSSVDDRDRLSRRLGVCELVLGQTRSSPNSKAGPATKVRSP